MLLAPEKTSTREMDYWDKLYDAKDRNSELYAFVVAVVQPETLQNLAWELEFEGITNVRGLVPSSETGLPTEKMMNYFVGKEVKVKIKGIDKNNGLIACTRREVVDESRARIIKMIEEGQEIESMVRFVSDIWVGLDLGGGVIVDLDRKKAGVSRSVPLNVLYQEGQIVKVIVEKVDKSTNEINVIPVDPWQDVRYNRGDVVSGPVVRLGEKNIFITVRPGVIGIAPYPVSGKPSLGDRLVFKVNDFNPETRSLSLGLFDPELIRGRKKNREYWKKAKQEQTDNVEESKQQP